ncbi:MAG: MFS transporter [Pseudomonadota bacterium]|nr:MFS transporter [Pseudomonadota bacterium]MDQ3160565.1 MFS transporter [Pseudomonadota bacterium]
MKQDGIQFHHPIAFWIGCLLVLLGVLAHAPMFWMGRHTGWQMVGMPMAPEMWVGMALIPVGLALSAWGLLPQRDSTPASRTGITSTRFFHIADGATLNRSHWSLVTVLVVALAVDVMKPATLGFVLPGLTREYSINPSHAGWLPFVAMTGTTVGSLLWGRLADVFGRRAAILLSALMFMGTAICGAMPSFGWNLVMCFLMGMSAGGLLPIAFTLMAETVPATHRGWLLVLLGGLGTSAGYLLASGAAAVLEPLFSWRILWLLGLPTGALILLLNRWIPESPRFLAHHGLQERAHAVLARFSGNRLERDDTSDPPPPLIDEQHAVIGLAGLLRGPQARVTAGLLVCGVAWGLVSFGFVLWLPLNLVAMGIDASATSALLARSALIALPGMLPAIWLYHHWSTIRSLVLFIALTGVSLIAFAAIAWLGVHSMTATTMATVALLVSSSGLIAMLIPYATEIYPVHLRGTGAGAVAAGSKFGGILGAALGVAGFFENLASAALLLALPMLASIVLLARHGPETRGQSLEDIQHNLALREPAA